jgi:K+-sensing histidine kinase KdpD
VPRRGVPRQRLRPWPATAFGVGLTAATGLALAGLGGSSRQATQAVVLVVPVVVAALYGGRGASFLTAVAATATFSLLIPPIGTPRINLVEDVVALIVFSLVALVVGALVAGRVRLLGEVDTQRSLLLRSVSHDLRTPLASIRAAASELAGQAPDAGSGELAAIIGDEAERLDRLVANLLSLSRLESPQPNLRFQAVDLGELAADLVERQRRLVRDHPVQLDVGDTTVMVRGDHALLAQVVTNLLENAVRHTPAASAVRVMVEGVEGVEGRAGVAVLEVEDDGPGIPPERRALIFAPFTGGGAGRTTGVGLAICRAVVEAHGGTISAGEGRRGGARFRVELPLLADGPAGRG